jgi:hypothetical protein
MHHKPDEFSIPPQDPEAFTGPRWTGAILLLGILLGMVLAVALVV